MDAVVDVLTLELDEVELEVTVVVVVVLVVVVVVKVEVVVVVVVAVVEVTVVVVLVLVVASQLIPTRMYPAAQLAQWFSWTRSACPARTPLVHEPAHGVHTVSSDVLWLFLPAVK